MESTGAGSVVPATKPLYEPSERKLVDVVKKEYVVEGD